jgi:hypothetical protein
LGAWRLQGTVTDHGPSEEPDVHRRVMAALVYLSDQQG